MPSWKQPHAPAADADPIQRGIQILPRKKVGEPVSGFGDHQHFPAEIPLHEFSGCDRRDHVFSAFSPFRCCGRIGLRQCAPLCGILQILARRVNVLQSGSSMMPSSSQTSPALSSPQIRFRATSRAKRRLNLQNGVYCGLDPVGARVWNLVQTPDIRQDSRGAALSMRRGPGSKLEPDMPFLASSPNKGLIGSHREGRVGPGRCPNTVKTIMTLRPRLERVAGELRMLFGRPLSLSAIPRSIAMMPRRTGGTQCPCSPGQRGVASFFDKRLNTTLAPLSRQRTARTPASAWPYVGSTEDVRTLGSVEDRKRAEAAGRQPACEVAEAVIEIVRAPAHRCTGRVP